MSTSRPGASGVALANITTRRVVRALTAEPVAREDLERILDAAAHAPSAGNRRLQRFVAIEQQATLNVLRMISPGMLQRPTAAIVICTDIARAVEFGFAPDYNGLYVDVGTVAQTILLAAHALGLGSGPVTSFSKAAVSAVLNLPESWRPEMTICLGHPQTRQPSGMAPKNKRRTWRDYTHWGRFPQAG
jgi:nitroreductase